jgi:hypothetical protein
MESYLLIIHRDVNRYDRPLPCLFFIIAENLRVA